MSPTLKNIVAYCFYEVNVFILIGKNILMGVYRDVIFYQLYVNDMYTISNVFEVLTPIASLSPTITFFVDKINIRFSENTI